MRKRNFSKNIQIIIFSVILLLWIFIPVYWIIKTAFSPEEEAWNLAPSSNLTLNNFRKIFSGKRELAPGEISMEEVTGVSLTISSTINRPLLNTLWVSVLAVTFTMVVSSLAGYNLARFVYPGKKFASSLILFAYVFPPFILMVPMTLILKRIGLTDSLFGLSIVHLAYTIPFATYMLSGYFMGIPRELDEAAMVDGCSRFQAFLRITLPLAAPGLVTVAIFSFVLSWGDVIFATVLINDVDKYTLPLHIGFFLYGGEIVDPGALAATTIFAGLVPALLYLTVQRFVRMGIVAGAVKG
ncbi:MAG: multiple sugar transport system permease protein [Candidatus Atribacteria bacterium]|jgi:ABC-type glycerol-3-phosphate transport system permease component|uniref:Maltose/maltodextrin transport system permease protein MalG n=1 Tax=Thermatribacter velox TaxID=3039681 RepID=A0ABZ2YEQ5_9BACT|nr:multiple sugar transport system permease protein [Candidatus Atribacteria bacterium]